MGLVHVAAAFIELLMIETVTYLIRCKIYDCSLIARTI